MTTLTAKYTFEIELDLSGTFSRGYAGDRIDPPEPDRIEDVDIEDMGVITRVLAPESERGSHRMVWKTTSILDGVDRKSEAYQQIVRNILALLGDEAYEALSGEVE